MRRIIRLFLVTVFVFLGLGAAQAAEVVTLGPQTTGLELEEGTGEIIHVRVAEVRLDGVEIDGAEWAVVRAPSAQNTMVRGLPSLPYLSSRYLLDRTGGISLELVNRKVRSIDLSQYGYAGVVPSKGHFDRGIDPATVPWVFDDKVYASDSAFPAADSRIADPFISGPIRGQALQIPLAFWQADTNTLTVVEEAWFRVVHEADASNPRLGADRPMTGLFESAVRANTLNYEAFTGRYDSFIETGRLLIIADDAFIDEVQPLADWENLVGYPTMLVPVSTAGATGAEIKSYIQSLYDAPEGLTWIILVGDIQQIPSLSGVNEGATCDPCYTKLEGADNRPDASISRISAQTEAQVTVQVAKILDYEQLPDTGSAGAWYSKAFGVAGNDTGGSPSYTDWERMDFLKDVLVDPAYNYTEFDELYHSPSKAEVAASINEGSSLGLYIGHGSDTSWVTSGFSVSDVDSMLTNAETLPVIWSVACVNGRFDRSGGDCFAEAWLKKDGGGAVSFEAATTNESWVPPCNAQRGIVDSLAQETAFTTGGQHVNGKLYCMDVDGQSNSSEGTKFMEQSTLFGVPTLWTRTLGAQYPEEPVDFSSGGGTATLTVTVGGAPLARAGAAIVSFYNETGGINVVGSGLIDAGGVVTATVTGDPTHCHIHGQNLIPTSFELAAREVGRVSLDGSAYACNDTVTARVSDSNVPGSSTGTVDTTSVELTVGGSPFVVTLTETAPDRNVFVGTAVLGVDLAVANGDVLVATYVDTDDGAGGVNVSRTANAAIDCAGPAISTVEAVATESSVTMSFATDEPGTTVVVWGTSTPPATVVGDDSLTTAHAITVEGVDPCTTIFFEVHSTDALGNVAIDTNGGSFYSVETAGWGTFFSETFDSDPGWDVVNGSHTSDGWGFGQPTGQGQDSYGQPDPTSGATGDNVYGVNLAGDIPADLSDNALTLTTPAIDLSTATSAQMRFQRWLGVETDSYDNARIRLSVDDGATWATVWENDNTTIDESAWSEQVVDLSAAVGQSQVRIQWTYGSTDGSWNYCGWNVDDVIIEGAMPCTATSEVFTDGFEGGDCSRWSMLVN